MKHFSVVSHMLFNHNGDNVIPLPTDAVLLEVHQENNIVNLYVTYNPMNHNMENRNFVIVSPYTGMSLADDEYLKYINSFKHQDGLIYHAFEKTKQ
jgi:hypothetical protein